LGFRVSTGGNVTFPREVSTAAAAKYMGVSVANTSLKLVGSYCDSLE
jgi:hypothetical protein